MRIEPVRVTCISCKHVFDDEVVVECTAAIWLASVRSLHCPECQSNKIEIRKLPGAKKT